MVFQVTQLIHYDDNWYFTFLGPNDENAERPFYGPDLTATEYDWTINGDLMIARTKSALIEEGLGSSFSACKAFIEGKFFSVAGDTQQAQSRVIPPPPPGKTPKPKK